jgi:hypothetical protein
MFGRTVFCRFRRKDGDRGGEKWLQGCGVREGKCLASRLVTGEDAQSCSLRNRLNMWRSSPRARPRRSCYVSIVDHRPIPLGLAMSNVARASRSCPGRRGRNSPGISSIFARKQQYWAGTPVLLWVGRRGQVAWKKRGPRRSKIDFQQPVANLPDCRTCCG